MEKGKGKDYVPGKDADFDPWFKNLVDFVDARCTGPNPDWTHIPNEARMELRNAYETWHAAYVKTLVPHTPVDTLAKNEARDAATAVLRPFVRIYLHCKPVTDPQRLAMGVNNWDTERTSINEPPDYPDYEIRHNKNNRQLEIHFKPQGTESKAVPYGYQGAVISTAVLDHVPTSVKELTETVLATASPYVMEYEEADRGKTAYFSLQWQNEKGQKGPPSDILSAIIP
jgi:hypothetical protein